MESYSVRIIVNGKQTCDMLLMDEFDVIKEITDLCQNAALYFYKDGEYCCGITLSMTDAGEFTIETSSIYHYDLLNYWPKKEILKNWSNKEMSSIKA